jgi:DUF4097 and DUF4098 domain-containing protein YvlB
VRVWPGLALALTLLSWGCDSPRVEETSSETMTFQTGENRPTVRVRLDEGTIEVTAADSHRIELELVKRARALDREGARSLLSVIRADASFDNDTLSIRSNRGLRSEMSFGGSLRTDVRLRVPQDVDLDLRTMDGDIELQGVSGRVASETVDGRIRLRRVRGRAKLLASDGAILGSDLEGDFDVASEDGRIELEGDFGSLDVATSDGGIRIDARATTSSFSGWSIRSSDGSIHLTLPATLSARLGATVADGRIESNLGRFNGRQESKRVEGLLGDGGPLILVTAMDGNITIEAR